MSFLYDKHILYSIQFLLYIMVIKIYYPFIAPSSLLKWQDNICPFFGKIYGHKLFVLFLGFRPLWSDMNFHFLNPIFLFIF